MNPTRFESDAILCDVLRQASATVTTDEPSVREAVGRLSILALYLNRSADLPAVPFAHWTALEIPLKAVPPQAPTLSSENAAVGWLQLASLAELHGCLPLARVLVDAVARRVVGNNELLALCDGQRGRIARTRGELPEATLYYKDAIRRSRPLKNGDAWIRAHCGLANVQMDLGNFPEAERFYRTALRRSSGVANSTRVYAWMGLSLVRRKRGDHIDAMLAAWNAFDLTDDSSPLRADLLISLAECALDIGDHTAALNGFLCALAATDSPRTAVAARTGIVLCQTYRRSGSCRFDEPPVVAMPDGDQELAVATEALAGTLDVSAAPQQRAFALLACVDAFIVLDRSSQERLKFAARGWIDSARELIQTYGFFEYQFREERLRALFQQALASSAGPTAPVAPFNTRQRERPTVVARLASLFAS